MCREWKQIYDNRTYYGGIENQNRINEVLDKNKDLLEMNRTYQLSHQGRWDKFRLKRKYFVDLYVFLKK